MYYEETNRGHIYINLIYNFWWLKSEIKNLVKSGAISKYGFIDGNGNAVPFIYNRIIF